MTKSFAALMFGVVAFMIGARLSQAQPAPVPKHDISGTWTPARGEGDGIQGTGARDMPEDGKPEHQLPYTAAAREKTTGRAMEPGRIFRARLMTPR